MKTKICTKCKNEKPLNQFCKGNDKDDLNYQCKKCQHEFYKIYYQSIIRKEKICLICNNEFLPKTNHQKCCSLKCTLIHNKNQRKKHRLSPKAIWSILKQNTKNKKFQITKEKFINWYNKQEQKCYYCERTLEQVKNDNKETNRYKTRLSIDRKDNNKGYKLNNIVLCCYRCNTIKGEYFTEQEMKQIGRTIYKNKVTR